MGKIYAMVLAGVSALLMTFFWLGYQGIVTSEQVGEWKAAKDSLPENLAAWGKAVAGLVEEKSTEGTLEEPAQEIEEFQTLSFSFRIPEKWTMEQVGDVFHVYFAHDDDNWADIMLYVEELTPGSLKPAIWEKTTLQKEKNEGKVEYDFPRYEKDSVLFTRWYDQDGLQTVLMATDKEVGIISYRMEGDSEFKWIIQIGFEYFLQGIRRITPEGEMGSEEETTGSGTQGNASASSGEKADEEGTFSSQSLVYRIPEGWNTLDMEGGYSIFRTEGVEAYGLVSILAVCPTESDPPISEWMDAMMEDAEENYGLLIVFPRYTKDGIHFAQWYDGDGNCYVLAATEDEYAVISFREEGDFDDLRVFQRDFEWFLTGITLK